MGGGCDDEKGKRGGGADGDEGEEGMDESGVLDGDVLGA
jgi:hypothetical protein